MTDFEACSFTAARSTNSPHRDGCMMPRSCELELLSAVAVAATAGQEGQ
jgi:hypothetical protein